MSTDKKLTILCAARLHANQLARHLELLNRLDMVERILLVRQEPIGGGLSKVRHSGFKDRGTVLNALNMMLLVDRLCRRHEVDWVVGFNPLPWGSVAWLGALRSRVPVCLGFLGSDSRNIRKPWAAAFRLVARRADLITVTGRAMRRDMVASGFDPARIRVLPHAVDTERFAPPVAPDASLEMDVVAVGRLVELKRINVLLEALAILRRRGILVRLGILGEGPQERRLKLLAAELGITGQVRFLGFRDDVENYLRASRLFALVSAAEGLPFALIEAMSVGVVPVVTDVGTIADVVDDGVNGCIVPVDAPLATADAIGLLLSDQSRLARLRANALKVRETLSLEVGVEFWRQALVNRPCTALLP